MTILRLVYGGNQSVREQAITEQIDPGLLSIALLEGLAADHTPLESLQSLKVIRIAAGCPCCTGNLTMRVMLNRALKEKPDRVYLSLASPLHLVSIRDFLQEDQYCDRLSLGSDINCGMTS
jgi:hypothetical protein